MTDHPTARQKIANLLWWSIPSHDTDEAKAKAEQMLDDHAAEVRRQHTEMLAPQQCPAGLHADWLVDSEYAHACPWCQIDKLRTDAAAELMPVWEAVYEPGNVSDYLIGYMNDQDAATGAAEAWMRSQSEVTGRLEWEAWGDATPMPDGYDRWFELAQLHDDGIDTGPGITVRRRRDPAAHAASAPPVAPVRASQPPEAPTEPETATEAPTGRVGDPRRTLTPNEYNAAWHAVEGAAGEEGADPGTVLHAVLNRLGIEWQDAARPAADGQSQPAV